MPSISVIIPVYNEEKRLSKTFDSIREAFSKPDLHIQQIIFVDDGSLDRTKDLILEFQKQLPNKVSMISYEKNMGKGFAVKQGMLQTETDYGLICDADMSTPLYEIKKMLPHMERSADIIIGTRKAPDSNIKRSQSFLRQKMGEFYALLAKITTGLFEVDDFGCGFKAFSKKGIEKIFPKLTVNGWIFDTEALLIAKMHGFKIEQVGITWTNDTDSKVRIFNGVITSLHDLFGIFLKKFIGKYK